MDILVRNMGSQVTGGADWRSKKEPRGKAESNRVKPLFFWRVPSLILRVGKIVHRVFVGAGTEMAQENDQDEVSDVPSGIQKKDRITF